MNKSPILFEIAEWARACIETDSSDWNIVLAHINARLQQLAPDDIAALHQQMALILDGGSLPTIGQH